MNKAIGITLAVIIGLVGLGFGGRAYATRAMSARAVTPKPLGTKTPAAAGLPFSRVAVEAGDRTLIGWWVRARADSGRVAPAVLFLHGNRSAISDYIDLQKLFYRQGISSMVVDYSGFGASGGSPSLENAFADVGSVARIFEDSAGKAARKVAFGSGLGSTVLLQRIDSVQPHVSGIVIDAVDASVRASAVRSGRIPKLVAPLVVDVGDNVAAAAHVRVPTLAIHSGSDTRVTLADVQQVTGAIASPSSVVEHWRKTKGGLLSSSRPCDWAPVLAFVRTGALPKAKLDSTNACEIEKRQAAVAAAQAAKDSAAKAGTKAKPGTKAPAKRATKTAAQVTKTNAPPPKTTTKSTTTKAKAPAAKAPTKKP
jgi:hypothetical protein